MKRDRRILFGICLLFTIGLFVSCGDDDSSAGSGQATDDETAADDDTSPGGGDDDDDDISPVEDDDNDTSPNGDDDDDDDNNDDDNDDNDDLVFTPWENEQAKAEAFRLYYKERIERGLLAYNRFLLVNDVVPAHTLGSTYIEKTGQAHRIQLHPKDNNEIGTSAFNTYQAWRVFGTRPLELTLIRQFEGLAVAEEVSGIPGLTCREWQPGFDVTIDGPAGAVSRTKDGAPVQPAETYSAALESEIIAAFFADGIYTYQADPSAHYFTIEPLTHVGDFAVTFVFSELPNYLRVSNCCSSFMVSQLGTFAGYFWGNHNSRDNFPDYAQGYFAACAAQNDAALSADVRASATRACASGKRIGDSVVGYGYNLMTVSEFAPYDAEHLIVAGELRPDGTDEGPEYLGSMNSCQMSYMAKALSAAGLHDADEDVDLPGAYEVVAIKLLFEMLGLQPPDIVKTCTCLDDAYFGQTWSDLLNLKVLGFSFWDIADLLVQAAPDVFVDLLLDLADATHQPEKAMVALVYYAEFLDQDAALLQETRETTYRILEFQRRSAQLAYDWAIAQPEPPQSTINKAIEELQLAATYGHATGVGDALYDPLDFTQDEAWQSGLEGVLTRGDSTPLSLRTDEEIWALILEELDNFADRPLTVARYWERFPTEADKPLRRLDDHYEAVGRDGDFHEIPNIGHQWFGGVHLWDSLPLCALAPNALDCTWAVLGCARPDLDGSGAVEQADQTLFDAAWELYGPPEPVLCGQPNDWCGGADLDRSGELDEEDQAFLEAARGCWY